MSKNAPIVLFVYNRPAHLSALLDTLRKNEPISKSHLYVFSDGPKSNFGADELERINKVREIVSGIDFTQKLTVISADNNKGLALSAIEGITQVMKEHGRAIVLEDDLLLSPFFLDYMNNALDKYADSKNVYQISGYMYPVEYKQLREDCLFLPYTTTWGWASWERAWNCLDTNMSGYKKLRFDSFLRKFFDVDGTYPYYKMLEKQIKGKINSWGIQWYLSVFIKKGLTLHPSRTLVIQNGFDESATHTSFIEDRKSVFYANKFIEKEPVLYPDKTEINQKAFSVYIAFFVRYKKARRKAKIKKICNPIYIYSRIRSIFGVK